MQTILIVIHLLIVVALVVTVLLQQSEGGGLGIGGGSGGGFMTARGAANALTRATAILATAFFVTSLALSIHARYGSTPLDILDRVQGSAPAGQTAPSGANGVLDQLGGQPSAPAPAAPSGDAAPAAENTAPAAPEPAGVPTGQ